MPIRAQNPRRKPLVRVLPTPIQSMPATRVAIDLALICREILLMAASNLHQPTQVLTLHCRNIRRLRPLSCHHDSIPQMIYTSNRFLARHLYNHVSICLGIKPHPLAPDQTSILEGINTTAPRAIHFYPHANLALLPQPLKRSRNSPPSPECWHQIPHRLVAS